MKKNISIFLTILLFLQLFSPGLVSLAASPVKNIEHKLQTKDTASMCLREHEGQINFQWPLNKKKVDFVIVQGAIAGYQVYINHTGDEDLKKFLENLIENDMNSEAEELKTLLKVNGIALPPAPPERPVASIEDIPPGARINDAEIAAAVSAGLAAGLVTCSQVMGKCLREDVGMLFGQFHMKKAQAGVALLRLSKKKGWVVLPPLHVKNSDQA